MTVEELQSQLEATLANVKAYIDNKDTGLQDQITQNREALEALDLSEDDLANLQEAIELADTLDEEWINEMNDIKNRVGNLLNGQLSVQSYASSLFSIS